MYRVSAGLICLTLFMGSAAGQQFWEKKPWTQWNKNDVQRMLTDSPWAQAQTLASVDVTLAGGRVLRGSSAASASDRDYGDIAKLKYTAQFRSAAIMRQALVRQLQLAKNYDGLGADQKKNFDTKTALFLSPGDPNQIVIFVAYEVSVPSYLIDLQRYWNAQTAHTLANSVFLSVPGAGKLSLADYAPAAGGFQFLFQRPAGAIGEGDIVLQFSSPAFVNIPAAQVLISFPTRKMVAQGATIF